MSNTSWTLQNKRVWVAGHTGLVGSAVLRRLQHEDCDCLTVNRADLDLRRQADVERFMADEKPDAIIIAAATVGGIGDNSTRPADYLGDNLSIALNIIHAAHCGDIDRLLFLGSSCIYPRDAAQPIIEDTLLTGALEPTNEAYAIAKIAGVKLCQAYAAQYGRAYSAAMPCNLYGPGDRYDEARSHVIPALMMKLHEAKQQARPSVTPWGSGKPLREFLHADDLADALVHLLCHYNEPAPINVGSGEEITIAELATLLADIIGYHGKILFDPSMPDGTPRKLLNSDRLHALGWHPSIGLKEGLERTYRSYCR